MNLGVCTAALPAKAAALLVAADAPRSLGKKEGLHAMDGAMDSLVQFCIDQRCAFDAAAWLAKFEEVGEPLALAAKYLSMTSWYGHDVELERVSAATQVFADNSNGLHIESQAIEFDLHAFSVRVRLGLARARRALHPAKPAGPPQPQAGAHEES